ncbi:MAG TPA: helix-turn-helix domain-containing protein [Gemmatimonadales bacterium]
MNPEDSRERLLAAAARVLADQGFAGTTTRRVAEEAGLNEVTLFRHFGTKERLLAEAVRAHGAGERPVSLPAEPSDPVAELSTWCHAHLERLRGAQALLRRCLGEQEQLPLVDVPDEAGADQAATELRGYVTALRRTHRIQVEAPLEAAAITMLVSALLVDGLARDDFPGVVTEDAATAGAAYARTFLTMLGLSASQR